MIIMMDKNKASAAMADADMAYVEYMDMVDV